MADQVKHSKFNVYDFFLSTKKRKTYTNLGVSLIFIIILVVFALVPTVTNLDSIRTKIKAYEDLNRKLNVKLTGAKVLKQQYETTSAESPSGLKNEIEFLQKAFLFEPDLANLYTNIQKRAKDHNIGILNFTPRYNPAFSQRSFEESNDSPSNDQFEISMNIEATSLSDLHSFISSFEGPTNLPILSRVRNVSIKNESKELDSEAKSFSSSLSIVVYLDSTRLNLIDETSQSSN